MNGTGTIINQDAVKDGEVVVVTKTVEERLTRDDILMRIDSASRQKVGLARQSKEIKEAYDALTAQINDYQQILELLPEEEMPIL
ncbi:MAG: hypothetical protein ACQET8_23235 [Bacillota bacterium]